MVQLFYPLIYSISYICSLVQGESAESKAKKKRNEVISQMPKEWLIPQSVLPTSSKSNVLSLAMNRETGILTEREIEITGKYTVPTLLAEIHSGNLTSLEVTIAFCKTAAIANQLTNCCTELMFRDALKRAQELDTYFISHGKPIGPLHGLPVSLKDSFRVPGYDSTIGFVSNIGNKNDQFSTLSKVLYDLGCVFYVKTNLPQFLMTCDSENIIFGRVLNPANLCLTAGGSSGGEGALIKQKGSIVGIGTDVGGSIRIPSVCCGIFGFKPSCDRLPYGGQVNPMDPRDDCGCGIDCSAGPMANDLESIEFLFKSVIHAKPWLIDDSVRHVEYQQTMYDEFDSKKVLNVGYYIEDPGFPLHPPMKRSILESAEKLKKAGHNLIEIKFPNPMKQIWSHATKAYSSEVGFWTLLQIFKVGELPIKSIGTTFLETFGIPPPNLSTSRLSNFLLERKKIKLGWNQAFINNEIDVLLCPGSAHGAVKHDRYGIAPYTAMWNVVDFPALIIPLLGENPLNLENTPAKWEYIEGEFSFAVAKYEPEELVGSISSVQLVCRNFEDEKLLACAKKINEVLNDQE